MKAYFVQKDIKTKPTILSIYLQCLRLSNAECLTPAAACLCFHRDSPKSSSVNRLTICLRKARHWTASLLDQSILRASLVADANIALGKTSENLKVHKKTLSLERVANFPATKLIFGRVFKETISVRPTQIHHTNYREICLKIALFNATGELSG